MLILFDIDGTLLTTRNAGREALTDAGREFFGPRFSLDGVDVAGRLDPLIVGDALAACGLGRLDGREAGFREVYGRHLEARLTRSPTAALLPGVADLVAALGGRDEVGLGLLTGNYPETGRLKITRAGLDADVFTVGAWGCDGRHRRDLPPVAIERFAAGTGRRVATAEVLVIGDTPHDVDCAAANGCRCLAVATGRFGRDELAEADLVLDDLSDVASVLGWVLGERAGGVAGRR